MARRIVKEFGEKTLDIIENEIEKLSRVQGIGSQRIEMIRNAWEEQKDIREVMFFLQSHGVGSGYAARIYKAYGKEAISIITGNPYRMAYDIFGIGFLTADRIAQKLGFAEDSPLRAEAGLLYALHNMAEDGHVYCPTDELFSMALEMLNIQERDVLSAAHGRLIEEKRIVSEIFSWSSRAGRVTYLAGYNAAEQLVSERLIRLARTPSTLRPVNTEKALAWSESKCGFTLAPAQCEAVISALRNKVSVITGGPGTGKSTILKVILQIYGALSTKIMLAAPTGRAAQRMTEATGIEARTIHRLLEVDMRRNGFKKNEKDPLDCDLLVLDEVSMVDLLLFNHLLKAIPRGCKLLLVGDGNQLPSVGAGSVLKDIIHSDVIPVVRLTDIFRQARESKIIANAHRIIHGEKIDFPNAPDDDMFFIQKETREEIRDTIVSLVQRRLPQKYRVSPFDDIQVLAPMNRGVVGVGNLNTVLQEAINPNTVQVVRGAKSIRQGDKVMQIRNNYDKDVFNGDIGIVREIRPEEQEVIVDMDGTAVTYDFSELDELVLAYTISIHKSQGAEYPVVIIPVTTNHYIMLQRNLIYTGVTRGKRLVILVGTKKALAMAIRNNKQVERYSALSMRLRNAAAA